MKYINLARSRNELVLITDMEAFTMHFCYEKRLRHDRISHMGPVPEDSDFEERPASGSNIEDVEIADEDEL